MSTMWVIHHKADYTKSIEEVPQPYSDFHEQLARVLAEDPGVVDIITQDADGFGDQYKLWEPEEAQAWQNAYGAVTGGL